MLRSDSGGYWKVRVDLLRRAVSEALGTAMLLAAVVGSGIMGERLAGGNVAIALLANTVARVAAPCSVEILQQEQEKGRADG